MSRASRTFRNDSLNYLSPLSIYIVYIKKPQRVILRYFLCVIHVCVAVSSVEPETDANVNVLWARTVGRWRNFFCHMCSVSSFRWNEWAAMFGFFIIWYIHVYVERIQHPVPKITATETKAGTVEMTVSLSCRWWMNYVLSSAFQIGSFF